MQIDKIIELILVKITKAGFEVAIVGGAVRDLLRKEKVTGWDLTTNATPEELLKIFKEAHYTNRFGTVLVPASGGEIIEVTTYRSEEGYSDARHPDKVVWGKTLEEDLKRRDFTINAIALRFTGGKLGEIVDLFGGQSDLKSKVIRAVGDANARFSEDALRMARAIRLATTLGFSIEEKTIGAIKKKAGLITKISGERIRDELFKIIASSNGDTGIMLMHKTGLLAQVLPELDACFSVEQKSPQRHHIYDVGTHCVMSMKLCPSKDVIVRLATLLHDIGKAKVAKVTEEGVRTFYNHELVGGKQVLKIADRLHLSRKDSDKLFTLVRFHQFTVSEEQTDSALRRFIRNIGVENIEDMMDLRIGDRLGGGLQQPESWRLKLFRQRLAEVMKKPFTVADLKVNGRDVMEILKIKPGPKVGEVLNKLFEEVLEDAKKNDRDYLLGRLKVLK